MPFLPALAQHPVERGRPLAGAVWILLIGWFLILSGCTAESSDKAANDGPPPSPLLYEISSDDGAVEGWLLGTIHALPDGTEWRTEQIDSVIAEADYAFVEVADLDDRENLSSVFAELATTPNLGPLSNRVSPSLRSTLAEIVERSDISERDFLSTESWAAAIMLAQVDADGRSENGVDRAIIRDFDDRGVRGFETGRGQLSIFDELAPQDQIDLLEGVVRAWDEGRADRGKLRRAWLAGDLDTLEEATNSGILADPELREALLVGRNQSWFAQLTYALRREERPLVAVGAAHLVGPDGLPAMLETQGFNVRRLH